MKKKLSYILLSIMLTFTIVPNVFAIEDKSLDNNFDIKYNQQLVNKVGFKLLNSSRIDKRIIFEYNTKKKINAAAYYRDRHIEIYKGLMDYIDSEDELAAVLAHEISHCIDFYEGPLRGYFSHIPMNFASKKYELKADKIGIDLMVKAGYNPIAMIVMMNKAFPQFRYDWWIFSSHPLTSKRMMSVYQYIYQKYPAFLVHNKYKDNIYYQNFLLTSTQNREKLKNYVENDKNINCIHYK